MKEIAGGYEIPEAVAGYIEERNRSGWRLRGERVVKFATIKEGDSVLDLCCGPGMVAKVMRETVGPTGKIVGIDISKDFIDYAQDFCNEDNVLFKTGDVENLSECVDGEPPFDVVVLSASWFWIKDKEGLLNQIRSVLKPGGKFIVSFSSDNLNDEKTNKFYWAYREKLKSSVLEVSPSADLSYLDKLPVMDDSFITEVDFQIKDCGFAYLYEDEVGRELSLNDKLLTYNNPARTEWVGDFPPDVRLAIIKKALNETAKEIGDISIIKRRTNYLVFRSTLRYWENPISREKFEIDKVREDFKSDCLRFLFGKYLDKKILDSGITDEKKIELFKDSISQKYRLRKITNEEFAEFCQKLWEKTEPLPVALKHLPIFFEWLTESMVLQNLTNREGEYNASRLFKKLEDFCDFKKYIKEIDKFQIKKAARKEENIRKAAAELQKNVLESNQTT